ncbi:MAG TPA: adenylate/guanylate cyclase domain-containing protein [Dongiaceae bacterium]|nr:adenylate/guanylate cyclase domain-containing protein [Dongiaceae bacterium]
MPEGPRPSSVERLKRALLAHVQQDFSAPAGAIVGFAEILLEEAPRRGLGRLAPDLKRIRESGLALQRLVEGLLDPEDRRDADGDYEAFCSRLRHDLRTPINAVKGYGEMLLEDARGAGAQDLVGDLEKMLDAATRLLLRIDSLVAFARPAAADPAADHVMEHLSQLLRPVPEAEVEAGPPPPSRILVVDDHISNRDLLARRLARDGHHVVAAGDGENALSLLEREPFDLVLLDLLMPGLSGYEVLCRLKGDPGRRELPVIMISALDEIESVVRCIEAGADDYMPKPCDPVLLRARINSSLERKRLRDRDKMFADQLRAEKERSESLLLNVLPRPIVARLQGGESAIADRVPDATILFADLVGFTRLSARLPAAHLVKLLNLLFSDFDRLALRFGLEKIKTIGDAYMVAGGLLDARGDHAACAADMALAMLDATGEAGQRLGEELRIRIGMHTGPVVAGIIGTHKFIYDIWGDTVNMASRLESHGVAGAISASAELHDRLRGEFLFEPAGRIDLKDKGPTEVYFLRGRRR